MQLHLISNICLFKTTIHANDANDSTKIAIHIDNILKQHNVAVMDRRNESSGVYTYNSFGSHKLPDRYSIITSRELTPECKQALVTCDSVALYLKQTEGLYLRWRIDFYKVQSKFEQTKLTYHDIMTTYIPLTDAYLGQFYSMDKAVESPEHIHYSSSWNYKTDDAIAFVKTMTKQNVQTVSLEGVANEKFWNFGFGW